MRVGTTDNMSRSGHKPSQQEYKESEKKLAQNVLDVILQTVLLDATSKIMFLSQPICL